MYELVNGADGLDSQGLDWVGPDLVLSIDKGKGPVLVPWDPLQLRVREKQDEPLNLAILLCTAPPILFCRTSGHGAPLAPGHGKAGAPGGCKADGGCSFHTPRNLQPSSPSQLLPQACPPPLLSHFCVWPFGTSK